MPDTAEKCPTCSSPVNDEPQTAPAAGPGVLTPGIPGLPTPQAAPGIPGLPTPAQQPVPNYLNPGAAPLGGAPMAAPTAGAPMGGGGGEIRVSLTGDVFEVPPPTARGAGPGGYAAGGGKPGTPPLPTRGPGGRGPGGPGGPAGSARPRYGLPSASAEEKKSASPVIAIVFVLLLLGGGAFGAFWWLNHRTDPKEEALAIYKSVVALDFKGLYTKVALTSADKAKYPDAETFASLMETQMNADPNAAMVKSILAKITDVQVGEPAITGNKADVPTSMALDMGAQKIPFKGTAHLVREWGVWKLDAGGDYSGMKTGQDLVGKPDLAALGSAGANLQGLGNLTNMPGR